MATLCRNTNTRLSIITDTLIRLRFQCLEPLYIHRHPARHQSRTLTKTRPTYRESLACTTNPCTTQPPDRTHNEPLLKPANSNNNSNNTHSHIAQWPLPLPPPPVTSTTGKKIRARPGPGLRRIPWTEEEDRELFQLVKEGKKASFIYTNHFRHRSRKAVANRTELAFKAASHQERQARDGVREGEPDVARSVAGDEGAEPLRVVYGKLTSKLRGDVRVGDKQEGKIQEPVAYNGKYLSRYKKWTRQEDDLLRQLVQKYSNIPHPHLWHEVSCGSIDGSKSLLRAPQSCNLRWRHLYPFPSSRTGSWSKQEELRLQEAISEQLEGKYQVAIDILVDHCAKKAKGRRRHHQQYLGEQRPELQQLPSQFSLPMLKEGGSALKMLNWVAIAERVKSRRDHDCLDHFYSVYHNGNIGPWSEEELRRTREGVKLFGKDYKRIADYVETRSVFQVTKMVYRKRLLRKGDGVKSEGDTEEETRAVP
ncbi:hypothetical protein BGZ88_003688 [Linnemannia elongata]|nr:hypothetical protein BGZ88_003688 [Linnemannia elongata]